MIETTKYQTKLEELLENVTHELRSIATEDVNGDWIAVPEGDAETADPNNLADHTEDWNERRATIAHLETRYRNIKHALKKIEMGEYGKCEICGDEIEEDRLEANPAARTSKAHMNQEDQLPMV